MIIYTEKYTESEYQIQNNNSLYKIHQTYQNTRPSTHFFRNVSKHFNFPPNPKVQKTSFFILLYIYISSIIHILYILYIQYILYILYLYIYIYIYIYVHVQVSYTCRSLRTKNPKNIPKNPWYENCSHFWDIF